MLFKDTLKELRKKKGISQYDLADALNISRSVIAKWETGLTLPSEESIKLLTDYFNVSREELFKNEETETIIVKKNVSISRMKKLISVLYSSLVVLIIAIIVIFTSICPKPLSRQLDKLGDFSEVKISLKYYDQVINNLDSSKNSVRDEVFSILDETEYALYFSRGSIAKWIGEYTIILEGDITIHLNGAYMIIDGEKTMIKSYSNDSINRVVELLISI